jgi:hypothetical protein
MGTQGALGRGSNLNLPTKVPLGQILKSVGILFP